jgi:hypothetical protein
VCLCGGNGNEDGGRVVKKIEEHIGGLQVARDFVAEPARGKGEKQSKLGAFWDGIRERASWQTIYGQGLY